jgi:hypothetical protein
MAATAADLRYAWRAHVREANMNKILVAVLAAGLATQAYAQAPAPQPAPVPQQAPATQPAAQNQNVECAGNNEATNKPFCWQKNNPQDPPQQQTTCPDGQKPLADGNCPAALPGAGGATAAASGSPNGAVIAGVVVGVIAVAALAGGGSSHNSGTTGTH